MTKNKRQKHVQQRGSDGKSKRKRKVATKKQARSHPLYGEIPMVPAQVVLANGTIHAYLDYDPDYKPPMPRDAVRGDIRKQAFCRMCHVPRYFHSDQEVRCVQCNADFTFTGAEQKYWYETLNFTFDSVAIRCKDCRRQRRSVKALHRQLGAVIERLQANPNDPAQLLSLAESTVQLWERTGQANLNRAIAATRKAARLWPESAPALFWEARCQEAAGRRQSALDLFSQYCMTPGARNSKAMWRRAETGLARKPSGPNRG